MTEKEIEVFPGVKSGEALSAMVSRGVLPKDAMKSAIILACKAMHDFAHEKIAQVNGSGSISTDEAKEVVRAHTDHFKMIIDCKELGVESEDQEYIYDNILYCLAAYACEQVMTFECINRQLKEQGSHFVGVEHFKEHESDSKDT